MTIEEALSNLEIAGLWPVSEAARKLWRDAMLAVHVEACHLRHATGSIGGVVQTTECGHDWLCEEAIRLQGGTHD